jgi:imidazolonepropionase
MAVSSVATPHPVDLLITGASQVVTVRGYSEKPAAGQEFFDLGVINNGFVAVSGGQIFAVGAMDQIKEQVHISPSTVVLDARGKIVLPGFVDSHTHLVFAGWRENEMVQRMSGFTYSEILAAGGGILETVNKTRLATEDELFRESRNRLYEILSAGTTTVEVKSGYGLNAAGEMKILHVIRRLAGEGIVDVVPTFLGAHAVPAEYTGDPWGYVRLVTDELLPSVAKEGLAEFVDVFCDEGVFSIEQSRAILERAAELGFRLKIHADELADLGGAKLAAQLGAVSADHLLRASRDSLEDMAQRGVIATLLPGTPFFLMDETYAPAGLMTEVGVPIALASDYNPGTCPMGNIPLVMTLACLKMNLKPEQAIAGVTINGAHALGRAGEIGSLEPGKTADCVLYRCKDYRSLIYRFGVNLVDTVIKKGRIILQRSLYDNILQQESGTFGSGGVEPNELF